LAGPDRRDALLEAAMALIALGDVEAVSMDAVAERAGVSRPLVYKHFANRSELLAAVYKRESERLYAELSAAVTAVDAVEDMFRALIRGAIQAESERGAAFAALRAAGLRTRQWRQEQRRRDRTTVRYFAAQVVRDFGLDDQTARIGVSILLGAIETVLAQWCRKPTRENAQLLEDTYVGLVAGGLERLASFPSTTGFPEGAAG
jgi:AcrR family transcriptional regulator